VRVALLTVFPRFFDGPLDEGMIRIARRNGQLAVRMIDLREHTDDVHRTTDDTQYGGGAGMVMKCDPIVRAVESLGPAERGRVFLTSARGRRLDDSLARALAGEEALTVICGRYKGVDERVIPLTGAEEISIGDYVLSGGEPAALVLLDAVVRHIPGVLGDYDSAVEDSHYRGLLGPPVYTRPEEYRGLKVPGVLLSGHHARIDAWRRREALKATRNRRPDLLDRASLAREDRAYLESLEGEGLDTETGEEPRRKGERP
jgi:tRNA (guanine37-N1)-methyltransferase